MKNANTRHAAAAAFFFACLALAVQAFAEPQVSQSVSLQSGWNAVYLEVQPEPKDPATVFAALPSGSSVWTWVGRNSTVEFIQNPSEGLWGQPGWAAYFNDPDDAFLTNLYGITANRAYLVHVNGAIGGPLVIQGRPSSAGNRWAPDSFNLVGLHVDPNAPPTFGQYFSGSSAHSGQAAYRLGASGTWEFINNPSSESISRGEAYWVYCEGVSKYNSTLDLKLPDSDGLNFGEKIVQQPVQIKNLSSVTKTVTVTFDDALNSSPVDLVYKDYEPDPDPDLPGKVIWPVLGTYSFSLEAGKTKVLHLAVRRDPSSTGLDESVLEISDDVGNRFLIPVSARN